MRYRGCNLPDDDAGRADLWELLLIHSLHPTHPRKHMQHEIALSASWMLEAESKHVIEIILALPASKRWALLDDQGARMGLTNVERHRIKAWTMTPMGMTKEELKQASKHRKRWRRKMKRHQNGVKPRSVYLENAAAVKQRCEELGVSKATYYRRLKAGTIDRETSPVPTVLITRGTVPVSPQNEVHAEPLHGSPVRSDGEVAPNVIRFPAASPQRRRSQLKRGK